MVKTKTKCIVPLSTLAFSILDKYNFKLPIFPQTSTIRYFKQVCKLAGVCDIVEKVTYKGGERVVKRVPKYKLVKRVARIIISYFL